ncbi:MAG: hypothetical protein ABI349_00805 [Casimicrobiaceae bacterium]
MFHNPAFRKQTVASATSGFLRNVTLPPRFTTAKMGGQLLPGSDGATTKAIDDLAEAVRAALDTVPDSAMQELVARDGGAVLAGLAGELGVSLAAGSETATLVPIEFAGTERNVVEREKDVARVIAAIEEIDGGDWLASMKDALKKKLDRDGYDEEDVDAILDSLSQQRAQPNSQVNRFINFLDDEALARVRLQVTFELMRALANLVKGTLLATYVHRVLSIFELFASVEGEGLPIDVSSLLGLKADFNLSDYLRTVMLYRTLPVWADWSTQIFEIRNETSAGGFATKREVSYRFRVNGQNPETGKSAFLTRVERYRDIFLAEPDPAHPNLKRQLAELLLLYLVVPRIGDGELSVQELRQRTLDVAGQLKADTRGTLSAIIEDLATREPAMREIANSLIHLLKSRSRHLLEAAERETTKLNVCVQFSVLDWTRVKSAGPGSTELLRKPESGDEKIEWFKHIVVTSDPLAVPLRWSVVGVKTRLIEQGLAPTGDERHLLMRRESSGPVLPIRWMPFQRSRDNEWLPDFAAAGAWSLGAGVDIEYDDRTLSLNRERDKAGSEEKSEAAEMRASACAAFALLVYVTLWEIVHRVKLALPEVRPTALMLRLHAKGRSALSTEGSQALYVVSQAVERSLARELPVKLQGFVTEGPAYGISYRQRGTVAALKAAFPLTAGTDAPPALDRVAVVTYVTRPRDIHPNFPGADGYLFISQTYHATTADATNGYRIAAARMLIRLVDSRRQFREPQLILEEIARLHAEGYRHIMLLSHHFGNRHIGRAAERHSPHTTVEFLEEASRRFPDVFLYPLRRDVFPATRLHIRENNTESGFEVVSASAHSRFLNTQDQDLLRGLIPIYTFATLAVPVDEGRPQSGFCTYFLDVEQRLSSIEWRTTIQQNMLGIGSARPIRDALISVLRGIHYLESERVPGKLQALPVLDPFGWTAPVSMAAAGELEVARSRRQGSVLLSFPALLAHVTKVLHKEAQ